MGANAQTTVQKFLSGAVLTAEQQNFSAATGVPVFATTVTRDAAFGGANKVLAEGQTCYLESTNVVQYYDGAAWATVGPAAAGALVRVGGATLAGSSMVFTGVFSSTYNNYLIVMDNANASSDNSYFRLQLGSATSNYKWGMGALSESGLAFQAGSTSDTAWSIGRSHTVGNGVICTVFNPNSALPTGVVSTGSLTGSTSYFSSGSQTDSTQFTAFTLTPSLGTWSSGTVNIYGYSLS